MNTLIKLYEKNRVIIKLLVTFFILLIIFSNIKIDELKSVFLKINLIGLIVPLIFLFISIILSFFRWSLICNCFFKNFNFMESVSVSAKSFFLSQVLPSSFGGDIYKVIHAKRVELPTKIMIKTIFIDRFLGFILLTTFFIYSSVHYFNKANIYYLIVLFPLLLFIIIFKYFKKNSCFYSFIFNFFYIFGFAFFAQFFTLLFFYFLLPSVGISLTFFQISYVVTLSLFISMVPISISGWGLREASLSYLMGKFFMLTAEGLVISIVYGVSVIFISIVIYMLHGIFDYKIIHNK